MYNSNPNNNNQFYINTEIINNTLSPIDAKYSQNLTKPILENPADYEISINRFRLPLSGIPLSKNNIPFQQWQISLSYNTGSNNWIYADEYIPQYNNGNNYSNNTYMTYLNSGVAILKKYSSNSLIDSGISYNLPNTTLKPLLSRTTNPHTLLYSGVATNQIFQLNPSTLTTLQTLNLPYNINNFCVDDDNNNLYIIFNNANEYYINRYLYNSISWIIDAQYTSNNLQLINPCGISFYNNTLYICDSSRKLIIYWTAPGEPTGNFINTNFTQATPQSLTNLDNNLIIQYQDNNNYDALYGTTYNSLVYNVNSDSQYTNNSLTSNSQITFIGSTQYIIGNYDNYTYTAPINSNSWVLLNGTDITMRTIGNNGNNQYNQLMAISIGNDCYQWNYNTVKWQKIAYCLAENGSVNGQINAMDFTADKYMLAVTHDNNLYKSSMPIIDHYYFVYDDNNNCELQGINSNSHIDCVKNISSKNLLNGICYVAPNFYSVNSNNSINTFNLNLQYQSNLTLSECSNITSLKSDNLLSNNLAVLDNNNLRLYNTAGSQLGNVNIPNIIDFSIASSNIFIALTSSGLLTYNFNNLSSIALTHTQTQSNLLSCCFCNNVLNGPNSVGAIYTTSNTGGINCYMFTDNTFTTNSMVSNVTTTNIYNKIQFNPTTNIVTCFYNNNNILYADIYIQSTIIAGYLIFYQTLTISQSPNINLVHELDYLHVGMLQWNKITTQDIPPVSSIAISKTNPNILYATATNGLLYQGNLQQNNNCVFSRLTNYTRQYQQIATISKPSINSTSNTIAIFQGTQLINTFNISNIGQFISTDKDKNIVLGQSNNINAYDLQGNTIYNFSNLAITPLFSNFSIGTLQDAGKFDLWSYQDYLNKINLALNNAYESIKNQPGYNAQFAPYVAYNSTNKLFSLVCPSDYLNNGSTLSKYKIYFNNMLCNMFLFPSNNDNLRNGYKNILIQNNTLNNNTVQTYQENSTISKFYDLVRIIVQTYNLPVTGDIEANNTNLFLITDIIPDTDNLSPCGVLIYEPTILRFHYLGGNMPLGKIDLYFSYGTKDGTIYNVNINPSEYASCKLFFKPKIQINEVY